MLQRDYVLRMVQQLTAVILRVVGLREAGQEEEALAEIGDAIGRMSGLSASLVHALSDDDLIQLLTARGRLDPERCLTLAELLREEANIYEDQDRPEESYPRHVKALRLYLEVLPELDEAPPPMIVAGLDQVIDRLEAYDLPAAVRLRLLNHFEASGRFDRAEDTLLDLIDGDEGDEMVELGRAFYARLLTRRDDELARGNLPRDEVLEGLAALDAGDEGT